MARLNNGKLIDGKYHSGEEILRDVPGGRRAVQVSGKTVKNLNPRKNYSPDEILRVRIMPDRSKGADFAQRSELSCNIIYQQIVSISENLVKGHSDIDFDDAHYDWMTIEQYHLPQGWEPRVCPLLILFPTEYPQIPPIGFYLPENVKSPHGHLYNSAYHGASDVPLQKGWKWYCTYVNSGSWKPAYGRYINDWHKGDNLFDYFTLIGEVLASDD